MNVYKFGGASVKDAEGVKNLFKIINTQRENLIIVVSAMGKMTDALEVLCNSYFGKTGNIAEVFQRIQDFHQQIIRDLFGSADSEVNARVEALYQELDTILKSDPSLCYDIGSRDPELFSGTDDGLRGGMLRYVFRGSGGFLLPGEQR